jgi:hypothetical protein
VVSPPMPPPAMIAFMGQRSDNRDQMPESKVI